MERTYVMLKPGAAERGIMGKIITRFEEKGLKITKMEMMMLNEEILKVHYAHIAEKPFFPVIVADMTRGPVVAMIVEGEDAIKKVKMLVGPTKWFDALPGTIRGDFAESTGRNLVHCTDPEDPAGTAEEEITRFLG